MLFRKREIQGYQMFLVQTEPETETHTLSSYIEQVQQPKDCNARARVLDLYWSGNAALGREISLVYFRKVVGK